MEASQRLAVYGTLAPGEKNHHHLAALRGAWRSGWVEGRLHAEGWGMTDGFPALVWEPGAGRIDVQVLDSPDLPEHWARLDAFEGAEYERVVVPIFGLGADPCPGQIYVLRNDPCS